MNPIIKTILKNFNTNDINKNNTLECVKKVLLNNASNENNKNPDLLDEWEKSIKCCSCNHFEIVICGVTHFGQEITTAFCNKKDAEIKPQYENNCEFLTRGLDQ